MSEFEYATTAQHLGVTLNDLNDLAVKGRCSFNMASRFGVNPGDVEAFLKGQADQAISRVLGFRTLEEQEAIATVLGQQGAAGFLLGYLWARAGK